MLSYYFVLLLYSGSAAWETNCTRHEQLEPPKCFFSSSALSGANPSFIGLEKSLDTVFPVQGLEVVVPCQCHSS